MYRTAVIDNNTLVKLTKLKHLNVFNSLSLLFQQIHIPQEVKTEYEYQVGREPNRTWILERLRPNQGLYSFCTQYDSIVLSMVTGKKYIDKGEAEVYAQQKRVNAHYILSDDLNFAKVIKKIDSTLKIFTALHIIAMMDISEILEDCDGLIKTLHSSYPFTSNDLRTAYLESANELGISLNKRILNGKCSFKRIGLI